MLHLSPDIADRLAIKYRNSSDLSFIAAVEPIKPQIMEVFRLGPVHALLSPRIGSFGTTPRPGLQANPSPSPSPSQFNNFVAALQSGECQDADAAII